jgi:hypothetical protein
VQRCTSHRPWTKVLCTRQSSVKKSDAIE